MLRFVVSATGCKSTAASAVVKTESSPKERRRYEPKYFLPASSVTRSWRFVSPFSCICVKSEKLPTFAPFFTRLKSGWIRISPSPFTKYVVCSVPAPKLSESFSAEKKTAKPCRKPFSAYGQHSTSIGISNTGEAFITRVIPRSVSKIVSRDCAKNTSTSDGSNSFDKKNGVLKSFRSKPPARLESVTKTAATDGLRSK